jgi:beta-N-acetylhexosaminidase
MAPLERGDDMTDDEAGEDRRTFLRRMLALGATAASAAAFVGLDTAQASPRPIALGSTASQPTAPQPRTRRSRTPRPTASFSAAQLAGQRVVYSYPGLTVPSALLQQIAAGQAAGVIFFGDNISSETQISAAIGQLRQAQQQSPVSSPLLLMTDQEGGLVRRLPGAPVFSEKQIGSSAHPAVQAGQAGRRAGENLSGVGMNVNLAPVLDVFYKAGNFIDQYQRSYSDKASIVSECGEAFIAAQQRTHVAATAKHFPGLGSAKTAQDTDAGPVTLRVPLGLLRSRDEAPYPGAIRAGVKLIMVSWAVYPALSASRPAGLSEVVVQSELRSRHRFGGVTITDALEAGALAAFGSYASRGILAAGAGMDLLLCSAQDVDQGQEVTSALATAYQKGRLRSGQFDRAWQRVTTLRHALK